ncbi:putative Phosphopantothenoylcysteine decarboxylase [Cladorrhinum samala]|uniref:Phosphopantothenoylcysteine decarboxylase n=1 Tax=Cladorrhinum samala TaxID=585594 RepID=A0AAV9HR41_9PEZI|nr:putative Phosphopantothenoylcysteine decarboxylase [Cladorrhinum samala]
MLSIIPTTGHDAHFYESSSSLEYLTKSLTDGKKHLLLAASGSVATIKLPVIISLLSSHSNLSIRVLLTSAASQFLNGSSREQPTISEILSLPNVDAVYRDQDEWGPQPWIRGKGVLHIELRRWADLLVIAPLSANTLAKIVGGHSDNLLTSVVRAWDTDGGIDGRRKRILVAPAMNSAMWRHPITAKQIKTLEDDWGVKETADQQVDSGWFEVIKPISKTLACGDTGDGAMASAETIAGIVKERLDLTE